MPRVPSSAEDPSSDPFNIPQLLAYVADLELEVDRLGKQNEFVREEARRTLKCVRALVAEAGADGASPLLCELRHSAAQLSFVLHDLQDAARSHPMHDQVAAIAVRPLVEQVFRWQQRLLAAPQVELRLELEVERVEWFCVRFRHIVDNLVSSAVRYRDPAQEKAWVCVGLRGAPSAYEVRVSDNGLPSARRAPPLDLFNRAGFERAVGMGVGLAIVKLLVEQSGGSFKADESDGQGAALVAILPRFDVGDFVR